MLSAAMMIDWIAPEASDAAFAIRRARYHGLTMSTVHHDSFDSDRPLYMLVGIKEMARHKLKIWSASCSTYCP